MTQDTEKQENLKTGFAFPQNEPLLIVRPCLLRFCRNIYPAAKLLSTFLYHARKCNEQEHTFTMYRTQEQLVKDMCGDISEKTLHDIAVPTLQLAGFLDLEEQLKSNRYTIDLIAVRQALALYISNQESQPQLEKFLIDIAQLEKFLISKPELEKSLIDKKYFLSQLEKVLIHTRKISNCQRGRKPSSQVDSEGNSQNTENKRYKRDITLENNVDLSSDEIHATPAEIEKQIARLQAALKQSRNTPPYPPEPQGGVTLTPAGNIPAAEGGNTQAQQLHDLFEQWNQEPAIDDYPTEFERTQMRETDHNAIPEPYSNATGGLAQETPTTTRLENATPEFALQPQEMPSSVPAHDESSNQAKEQGEQQANGINPIASGTIENPPAPPPKTSRGRGGKGAGKEEKPKKAKPVVPVEEMTLRKEVHVWVNQRRGYSLQNRATTKQIIDENTACITLGHMLYVAQYEQNTEEGCIWDDLSFVWDYSVRNDKYWSQPNNKSRFGAHALLQMFAQTIVKRKPNNVTPIRPVNNPPIQQEPTAEKVAKIDAIQERLAKMQQPKQAVI